MHLTFQCTPVRNCAKKKIVSFWRWFTGITLLQSTTSQLPRHQLMHCIGTTSRWEALNPSPQLNHKWLEGEYKDDVTWVKTLHAKHTTKSKTGHITEVVSLQSVWIDEILCHVKDLQPFSRSYLLLSNERDTKVSEWLIFLGSGPPNDGSKISSQPVDADKSSKTPGDSPSEDGACVVTL